MSSILIVDDEALVRQFLRTVLESDRHEVLEANNGKEALNLVHAKAFDLLIIDLIMPVQEGLETIGALRREGARLKIIAMSGEVAGFGAELLLKMAEFLGADDTMVKPLSSDVVLDTVQRLLALA
jgi:CheY-like chemotaxis protein